MTPTTHPAMTAEYAVLIGTERGSLHYRTFPSSSIQSQSSSPSHHLGGGTSIGGGSGYYNSMNRNSTPIQPLGGGEGDDNFQARKELTVAEVKGEESKRRIVGYEESEKALAQKSFIESAIRQAMEDNNNKKENCVVM